MEQQLKRKNTRLAVAINRNRWLRGRPGHGLLRNPLSGNCCATGWACLVAGMNPSDIDNARSVAMLDENGTEVPVKLARLEYDAQFKLAQIPDPRKPDLKAKDNAVSLILSINDDAWLEDRRRETMLIDLGRSVGLEFSFHGHPLPKRGHAETNPHPVSGIQERWDGYSTREVMTTTMILNTKTRTWEERDTSPSKAHDFPIGIERFGYATLRRKAMREKDQVVRVVLKSTDSKVLYDAYLEPGEDLPE